MCVAIEATLTTQGIIREKLLRWRMIITYLAAGLLLTMIFSISIGPVYVPPAETLGIIAHKLGLSTPSFSEPHAKIILQIRLPRVVLGALVGSALSIAGVMMQGLFRNPLADPYVLGVSSGASLGAALSLTFFPVFLGIYTTTLAAFIGGLLAIVLVYNITMLYGRFTPNALILAGVAISFLFSAVVSTIVWRSSSDAYKILSWIMGGLWGADWLKVKLIFPYILFSAVVAFAYSRDLNALLLGEEIAQSLGVSVSRLMKLLPILASLITGAAVSFTGAIGFIGLMIPHIMRLIVGPDHRILIPSSALAGGIFLMWADTLARLLMELPVGVITAMAGSPFFIHLMRRRRL